MTRRTTLWIGIPVALLLAIGVVLAIIPLNLNLLRGPIARAVGARTGSDLTITGDLRARLLPAPSVWVQGISFSSSNPAIPVKKADIDALHLRMALRPLLKGRLFISDLTVAGATLLVEPAGTPSAGNRKNPSAAPWSNSLDIARLVIKNGVVFYRDPGTDLLVRAAVATNAPTSGQAEPTISVQANGHIKDQGIALTGQGGSLLSLLARGGTPYPINIKGRIGDIALEADGTLTDPIRLAGVDIRFQVQGKDLSRIGDISGTPVPATPPYALAARLGHRGTTWNLDDFKAALGSSRMSGSLALDLAGKRPRVRGDLAADFVDLHDFAGLIGKQPPKAPGAPLPPTAQNARLFSAKPYNLARLRNADADIGFVATRIKTPSIQVDDLSGHLLLDNGVLELRPANFGIAGGNVKTAAILDARKDRIHSTADITVSGIAIRKLFPKTTLTERTDVHRETTGYFGGQAHVVTNGNSPAAMAASANGNLSLIMSGGRVSDLLAELLELDIGATLSDFLGGDADIPMHCAIIDTKITDGTMRVNTFFVDTKDNNITGGGTIDLGKESLDLAFRTKPKDVSIVTTRAPLYARGSLEHPEFAVDKTKVAERLGAAVALGALVNPLAALVPLIETGHGSQASCSDVLAQIAKSAGHRDSGRRFARRHEAGRQR